MLNGLECYWYRNDDVLGREVRGRGQFRTTQRAPGDITLNMNLFLTASEMNYGACKRL